MPPWFMQITVTNLKKHLNTHFVQITFSLLFAMTVLNEATKIIGIKWT